MKVELAAEKAIEDGWRVIIELVSYVVYIVIEFSTFM